MSIEVKLESVFWDRLPAHRSRMVQHYIATLRAWIHQEYLPSYAPDLNPVEYIWAHWKQYELPNGVTQKQDKRFAIKCPAMRHGAELLDKQLTKLHRFAGR